MDLIDIISGRVSIRNYTGREVEDEKINKILEAARLAPSACNKQPWRFVVVKDKENVKSFFREGLGGIVSNKWASTAPVFIVACAELDLMVHKLGAALKSLDWYLIDMGIAVEHMVLQATELGLGTCWIGWFNENRIKKLLDIPKKIKVVSVITLGYPKAVNEADRTSRFETDKIVFREKWRRR